LSVKLKSPTRRRLIIALILLVMGMALTIIGVTTTTWTTGDLDVENTPEEIRGGVLILAGCLPMGAGFWLGMKTVFEGLKVAVSDAKGKR
jgi:hypothetical protein